MNAEEQKYVKRSEMYSKVFQKYKTQLFDEIS